METKNIQLENLSSKELTEINGGDDITKTVFTF